MKAKDKTIKEKVILHCRGAIRDDNNKNSSFCVILLAWCDRYLNAATLKEAFEGKTS